MSAVPSSRFNAGSHEFGLFLRPDLITQQMPGVDGWRWVVKDPISNEFHFFTDLEMKIMRSLNGQPLSAVMRFCFGFLQNEYLSEEGLVTFLADLQHRGLLKSAIKKKKAIGIGEIISPLAIRLPGFNPEAFLNHLYPLLAWIFHPVSLLVTGLIMAFAVVRILFQSEKFFDELPSSTYWLTPDNAWTLVVIIGITKVIHELAHGLTCRHFGGRCTEMGVMLLVFIPSMYCDVSDTWLQPSRWARICVSAAGMYAELFLAACAAMIWSVTHDGTMHSICLAMMLVGCVKTLVFNGNPLMRYDGYFILSDLLRVPNLASEGRQYLVKKLKSAYLGTPPGPAKPPVASGWLLITYALASILYQFFILGLILYGIHRFFQKVQLGSIGSFLIVCCLSILLVNWWRSLRQWRLSRMEMRYLQPRRLFVQTAVGIGTLLLLILYPLPLSISVPYSVEAVDARQVHVMVAGELVRAIAEGSEVHHGDWLATLKNSELDREINLLRAEEATLHSRLDQALSRRGAAPDITSQIPTIRAAIESARKRREVLEEEHSRLTLYSPIDGMVFAPRSVNNVQVNRRVDAVSWNGTPLDSQNVGCYLTAGTVVCAVGHTSGRQMTMMVSQQEVELIRLGQNVRVYISSHYQSFLPGVVQSIESSPSAELPSELLVSGKIPIDPRGPQPGKSLEPMYRVSVRLNNNRLDELPVRTVGKARIQLSRNSLLARIHRFVSSVYLPI